MLPDFQSLKRTIDPKGHKNSYKGQYFQEKLDHSVCPTLEMSTVKSLHAEEELDKLKYEKVQ